MVTDEFWATEMSVGVGVAFTFGGYEGEVKLERHRIDRCLPSQWMIFRTRIRSQMRPAELISSTMLPI